MTIEPLVTTSRGNGIENIHHGSVAVVALDGRLTHRAGDPDFVTFTRSALKPFQAVPFVRETGPERFGWSSTELALMCASHSGEPVHADTVAAMLATVDCGVEHLQCGCHVPGFYAATRREPPHGTRWSPLQHNCSGKHAGFLAACRAQGDDVGRYLDPASNLHRRIAATVGALAGVDADAMPTGTDGCSAPNYALPLSRLALLYARLAAGTSSPRDGDALERLFDAMTRHPELVSGTARSDQALMAFAPGDWVTKIGADGVQAIGIRSAGIGIAVKVADGNREALYCVVVEVLRQLGFLDRGAPLPDSFAPWHRVEVRNARGTITGSMRAAFTLRPENGRGIR